jgi:hypothetical protein
LLDIVTQRDLVVFLCSLSQASFLQVRPALSSDILPAAVYSLALSKPPSSQLRFLTTPLSLQEHASKTMQQLSLYYITVSFALGSPADGATVECDFNCLCSCGALGAPRSIHTVQATGKSPFRHTALENCCRCWPLTVLVSVCGATILGQSVLGFSLSSAASGVLLSTFICACSLASSSSLLIAASNRHRRCRGCVNSSTTDQLRGRCRRERYCVFSSCLAS